MKTTKTPRKQLDAQKRWYNKMRTDPVKFARYLKKSREYTAKKRRALGVPPRSEYCSRTSASALWVAIQKRGAGVSQ